jgi:hypothetical protein
MSMESDFTRIFPPRKSGAKGSGVKVYWLTIDGYLEELFHSKI